MVSFFCTECGVKFDAPFKFCGACGSPSEASSSQDRPAIVDRTEQATAATYSRLGPEAMLRGDQTSSSVNQPEIHKTVVMVAPTKSVGIALLLAIFFGPLGMLYSTVVGGITMMVVSLIVGLLTLGFGLFVTWPICVIWAAIAANSHNSGVMRTAQS